MWVDRPMAEDARGDWTSREAIDIDDMQEILGEPFLTKEDDGRKSAKNGDDVMEAFAELCKGREQVVGGVKALKVEDLSEFTVRGLPALTAILDGGHFCDLQELKVCCRRSSSNVSHVSGQKFCDALGSGCLKNLQILHLIGNGFGGEGIEALGKSLQSSHPSKLEVLRLQECLEVGEAGCKAVKALADTIASGYLSSLLMLDLSWNEYSLEPLELSQNQSGPFLDIGEALASGPLTNLRELILSHSDLGPRAIHFLAKSFESGHFPMLESLELQEQLGDAEVDDAGAESLAKAFASGHLGNLRKLDLSVNSVGPVGAKSLGEAFGSGHLKTLKALNLGLNDLKDEGVESLVASSHSGSFSNLETLNLYRCGFEDGGAKALAESFHSGKYGKLRDLSLDGNRIGRVGLAALVEAFKSGRLTELKTVSLEDSHSTDSDLIEIAGWLGTGSLGSLESFYLFSYFGRSVDRLSPEAKRAFVNAYQKNPYLVVNICDGYEDYGGTTVEELNTLRGRNEARVARFRKLQDEEEVLGEHGKVFLCGNPGMGKTTLRTTLTKGKTTLRTILTKGMCGPIRGSPNVQDREPTRGIEVSSLHSNVSSAGVRPVTLALWDMAGQHDYEVLHSAFLPELNLAGGQSTFFVIVCNANNGRNTPEIAREHLVYWLRFIASNSVEGIDAKHRRKVFVVFNCFAGNTSGHEKEIWTSFLADCKDTFERLLNLHEEPTIMDVMNKNAVRPFRNFLLKETRDALESRKMPQICRTVQEHCREWVKENAKYPVLEWDQFSDTVGKRFWEKGRLREWAEDNAENPVLEWDQFSHTVGKRFWEEGKLRPAAEYLHEAGHLIIFKKQTEPQASGSEIVVDSKSTGTQQILVILDPQWFCQNVVGNILLPNHLVKENEEPLRGLRREHSEKLPISAFKKFVFKKSGVPEDKIDEVVVLLSCIGLCYELPGRVDDIFIPALIEGNDERGWSTGSYNRDLDHMWVMGFALVVQNLNAALLPIAVLRRLQVDLAVDSDIGRKPDCGYSAGRLSIKFTCEGMDVLVEYSVDPTTSESKQDRIDVLVKPSVAADSVRLIRRQQTKWAQRIVNRILNITRDSSPGVRLDQQIVRPWSISEEWQPVLKRDIQYSVHELKRRVEDKGVLGKTEWIIGNEQVEEEDLLAEEDLVSFQNLVADRLICTEEAVKAYGLLDSEFVEPIQSSSGGNRQSEFTHMELTPQIPDANTKLILEALQRGFREAEDSRKRNVQQVLRMLEDVKGSIKVILQKQSSLNYQIQNLERFSIDKKKIAVPRFAYLTEKGQKKWRIKVTEKMIETLTLRFLCEASYATGTMHEVDVDDQEGISVRKIRNWARNLVPVLRWTFKISFVAAKIASNAVLPGLGLLLDSASFAAKTTWELEMTRGLGELANYLDEGLGTLDHDSSLSSSLGEGSSTGSRNSKWVQIQERELRGLARTAVLEVFNNLKPLEMKRQVGLTKVWLGVEGHGQGQVVWICEQCFKKYGSRAHEI